MVEPFLRPTFRSCASPEKVVHWSAGKSCAGRQIGRWREGIQNSPNFSPRHSLEQRLPRAARVARARSAMPLCHIGALGAIPVPRSNRPPPFSSPVFRGLTTAGSCETPGHSTTPGSFPGGLFRPFRCGSRRAGRRSCVSRLRGCLRSLDFFHVPHSMPPGSFARAHSWRFRHRPCSFRPSGYARRAPCGKPSTLLTGNRALPRARAHRLLRCYACARPTSSCPPVDWEPGACARPGSCFSVFACLPPTATCR